MLFTKLTALVVLLPLCLVSSTKVTLKRHRRIASSKASRFAKRAGQISHILANKGATNVSLKDYYEDGFDLQWYAPIQIGTPPQRLVIFDTGSTDLLIDSRNCTYKDNCGGQRKFAEQNSSTYSSQHRDFEASFGTGTGVDPSDVEGISGVVGSDTVCVGGLCALKQTLGLILSQTFEFSLDPFDGILGLAFPQLGVTGSRSSFFGSLVKAKAVKRALYGFYLTPEEVGNAELTLGDVDHSKIQSKFTFANVTPPYWNVTFDALTVNNQEVKVPFRQAIFDTGTSNVFGYDIRTVQKIYAQISPEIKLIDKRGAFGIPCDRLHTILRANVDFTISGKRFTIPTAELVVREEYPSLPGICQTFWNADPYDLLEANVIVIGGSLLKYYYSVWDYGGQRFGLADTDISPPRGDGI